MGNATFCVEFRTDLLRLNCGQKTLCFQGTLIAYQIGTNPSK